MCARYSLTTQSAFLEERFNFSAPPSLGYAPAYNIAPTEEVLVVLQEHGRQARMMRWGLVPFWAKDFHIGAKMINARAETIATNGAFKNAFQRRRCLVLADGFYEWAGKEKTPLRFVLKSREPFAFAGLWESWRSPQGQAVRSCTIVTTTPNRLMAPVHDRMPVILARDAEDLWLDPSATDLSALAALLRPPPEDSMDVYQVSPVVNNVKNKGPECIAPVA